MPYFNPYNGLTFVQFFMQLFLRLFAFLKGEIAPQAFASDEIQLIVLMGVAASTAILGCFLVLRKMTMLANALSHTILLGICGAYFLIIYMFNDGSLAEFETFNLGIILFASILMGVLTTFLTEFLNKSVGLYEDSSISIVFSTLFALGIVFVTLLMRNAHIGTEVVMGNVDGLQLADCQLVYIVLGLDLLLLFLYFKEFQVTTFDQGFSRSLGMSPKFYNYLLMIFVSATVVSAFRAVGVLMVLSFLTGPPLTARFLTNRLKVMILFSVLIGIFSTVCGVALSRHILTVYDIPLSTGGIIVCLITLFFLMSMFFARFKHSRFILQVIQK